MPRQASLTRLQSFLSGPTHVQCQARASRIRAIAIGAGALEIEWAVNVLSNILDAQGLPPIAAMTVRRWLKAGLILFGLGENETRLGPFVARYNNQALQER